jgi:hypothetical protein
MIDLIRHEVVRALRAHGRVCAIELLAAAPTAATWSLVGAECASLGSARGHYRRSTLARACDLVALGLTDDAAHVLAVECGMTAVEWADETRREMAVAA